MIISHANRFIFFKPMKVAGSSIEVGLIKSCGPDDLITGGSHLEELDSVNYDYLPRNNERIVKLKDDDAKNYLIACKELGFLPNHFIIKDNVGEIECPTSIFGAHATPEQFLERIKDFPHSEDYHRITVVRNPWDQMVSFFWWFFDQPEHASAALRAIHANSEDYSKWAENVKPLPQDGASELKRKFESFLRRRIDGVGPFGLSEDVLVTKWFGEINSKYYDCRIDTIIRFEKIREDYVKLCDKLKIKNNLLPRLKGGIKKKDTHFSKYYTTESVKLVSRSFNPVIEKFGYRFEEK
jgi:hypothetical protein